MICFISQVSYSNKKILFAKTYLQQDKNASIEDKGFLTREELFKLVRESQETFRANIGKNANDKYVGQIYATLSLFDVDGEMYLCNVKYFRHRKEDMVEEKEFDFYKIKENS